MNFHSCNMEIVPWQTFQQEQIHSFLSLSFVKHYGVSLGKGSELQFFPQPHNQVLEIQNLKEHWCSNLSNYTHYVKLLVYQLYFNKAINKIRTIWTHFEVCIFLNLTPSKATFLCFVLPHMYALAVKMPWIEKYI